MDAFLQATDEVTFEPKKRRILDVTISSGGAFSDVEETIDKIAAKYSGNYTLRLSVTGVVRY